MCSKSDTLVLHVKTAGFSLLIDHIHNNRHVGFDIIMQISHVVCQGANIKMMLFLRKSAGLNSEVSAPKSHLRAKM